MEILFSKAAIRFLKKLPSKEAEKRSIESQLSFPVLLNEGMIRVILCPL